MIEVGKKYLITIEEDCYIAFAIRRAQHKHNVDEEESCSQVLGTITHIHSFGFLFKLDKIPKTAELNILWTILKWIIEKEED